MARFIQMKLIRSFLTFSNHKRNYGTKIDDLTKSLSNICTTDEEVNVMETVHKEVVYYLINCRQIQQIPGLAGVYKKTVDYNVGHYLLGYLVIPMYKTLANKEDLTKENIKLATVLAWCYDLFLASNMVLDDMTDGATTRRNKLVWHKNDNVGLRAVNHSFLLETSVYLVVSKYFRETNIYRTVMEIFRDTVYTAYLGQTIDNSFVKDGKPQLELYIPERYKMLTYYKAGYPIVYFISSLASCLAGKRTREFDESVKLGAYKLGLLMQSVNDISNCFYNGTDEMNSDIAEGKCSWLVVRALEKASPTQKQIIEKYYGRADAEAKMAIKTLYEELELRKDHNKFKRETLNKCHDYIKRLPNEEHRLALSEIVGKFENYCRFLDKYSDEKQGNATLLKISW